MSSITTLLYDRDARIANTAKALERYGNDESYLYTRGNEPGLLKGYESEVRATESSDGLINNIVTYAMTTDAIDRANDRVDPSGINLRNFGRNAPALWSHQHDTLNVGKWVDLQIHISREGWRGIVGKLLFHRLTDLSRELNAMAAGGFMNTVSIGFIPLEWKDEDAADFIKRGEAYPYTDTIRTYTKSELLECSLCNVPMNPTALIQNSLTKSVEDAIKAGVISQESEIVGRLGMNTASVGFLQTETATQGVPVIAALTTSHDPSTPPLVIDLSTSSSLTMDNPTPTEIKGLEDELVRRELYDEIWKIENAVYCLVKEAIESFVEDGDLTKLIGLPIELQKARQLLADIGGRMPQDKALIDVITKEFRAAIKEKAGQVLSSKNKSNLVEARNLIDTVIESASKGEEEGEKGITITFEEQTARLREAAKTSDELQKILDSIEVEPAPIITMTRDGHTIDLYEELLSLTAVVAELKAYMIPDIALIDDLDKELSTEEKTDEENDDPIVSIFG